MTFPAKRVIAGESSGGREAEGRRCSLSDLSGRRIDLPMLRKLRPRSVYDVIALLALVVGLIGTGSAVAAIVISSNSQVAKDTISGHRPPSGKHANIVERSIGALDIARDSISGAEIASGTNVQTCAAPLLARYGRICAHSDGQLRNLHDTLDYCSRRGLRLPTLSEAVTLAQNYNVPGVHDPGPDQTLNTSSFWADQYYEDQPDYEASELVPAGTFVRETGTFGRAHPTMGLTTVCVTDPSA
jgi:hypothetical protein